MKDWKAMDERELVKNLTPDQYYKVKLIQIFGEEKAKDIWKQILKDRETEAYLDEIGVRTR